MKLSLFLLWPNATLVHHACTCPGKCNRNHRRSLPKKILSSSSVEKLSSNSLILETRSSLTQTQKGARKVGSGWQPWRCSCSGRVAQTLPYDMTGQLVLPGQANRPPDWPPGQSGKRERCLVPQHHLSTTSSSTLPYPTQRN